MQTTHIQPITDPIIVGLTDGREAALFVPDLNTKQELCIVPKRILSHLTSLLPKAKLGDIIEDFSVRAGDCSTMHDWMELLEQELEFNACVNMLQKHFAQIVESEHAEQTIVR